MASGGLFSCCRRVSRVTSQENIHLLEMCNCNGGEQTIRGQRHATALEASSQSETRDMQLQWKRADDQRPATCNCNGGEQTTRGQRHATAMEESTQSEARDMQLQWRRADNQRPETTLVAFSGYCTIQHPSLEVLILAVIQILSAMVLLSHTYTSKK